MGRVDDILACVGFHADVIHWRGPPPYLFAPVPDEHVGEVHYAARMASYGWGCIPVEATIGPVDFKTSLFPKDGTYLLPIKAVVQKAAGVGLGDRVHVLMRIRRR